MSLYIYSLCYLKLERRSQANYNNKKEAKFYLYTIECYDKFKLKKKKGGGQRHQK